MEKAWAKIIKNSVYGQFDIPVSDKFILFDPELAERITIIGKKNIRKLKTKINGNKNN